MSRRAKHSQNCKAEKHTENIFCIVVCSFLFFSPYGHKDQDTSYCLLCPVSLCCSLAQHCQSDLLAVQAMPDSVLWTSEMRSLPSVQFTSSVVSPFLQLGIVLLCVPILYYSFNIHQYKHRISEPSFFRSPQQDFCGGDLECKGCYVPDEWSLKVRHGSCLHFVQLPV